uniref:Sorbin and SH3 domain-containing protein 2 n=1 Tax=Schistocephalus solidus TaxID=70667 RepID=A0A0X3PNC3_SCHSO
MLVLLKRVDPNWYYACTPDQERTGFIPVNFLDVRIDVPTRLNTTEPVVPPSFSNPPPATIMQEDPYKKVIDSCIYDIPKARPPTPTNTRNEDEVSTSSQSNEVIQWVEPGAKRGETPPEDWINCAKLNGVRGEFPGNLVRPLSDDKEIKTYLKNIPQAEAIKDYEGVPGQCIALEKGEVIYLSGEDATFCYGRSASGKQGKVPKTVCKVTVPLH